MRSRGIAILSFLASTGILSAQFGITTTSVPNAVLQTGYGAQLQSTGGVGQVTWSLCEPDEGCAPVGNLPPGLNLSNSGLISGTPTAVGNYNFGVVATDSQDTQVDQALSIQVNACVPSVGPGSPLPPGDVSLPYMAVHFSASDCPESYAFTFAEQQISPFNPNEPPGLSVTPAGLFSGTPTSAGTFSFLLTVTDQYSDSTSIDYSITINPLPTITTTSLPNGPVGVPYSQQITAKGGTPPYTFAMDGNVPGITVTPGGVLSGTPTQAGTFPLRIGVTDSLGGQGSMAFQVTFGTAVSQIQVAPGNLTFNANLNGNSPPPESISVVPATGSDPPVSFRVVIDNGQSGTAAPSWIGVSPLSGTAPASLVVSVDQGTMAAGGYPARIQVLDSDGLATDVAVTLNVASAAQQLTVAPAMLNLAARAATPGNLIEELAVSSSGAGTLAFTAAVVGGSSWISSVTASSNSTTQNAPVLVQVQVNTSGLQVGAYHDAILVSSSAGNVQIPVSLFVAASGPILGVDTTGVLFQAIEGGGSTATQTVKVLNLGVPNSTVHWNASVVSGSNVVNLVNSSGTATSSGEGNLTLELAPNATDLAPGAYYAIVKITDSNSLNSPLYVTVVVYLQPSNAAPAPNLAPGGLLFTAIAGAAGVIPAQQVQVNASSSSAVTFNATTSTADGGTWLSVTPASGNASGQTAGSLSVSVDPTGLAAGIYSGNVNVSIGALLESVNVTFIVSPVSSSNAALPSTAPATRRFRPEAVACAATKLAITETSLPNNFAVPAGWPATLIVQLADDCASPVTNGSVIASFSNGDAPLNLVGDQIGNYSATWQPGGVNANMVITLNAAAGSLQPATAHLYGGVAANQTPPPTLAPGGTVNNLNPVVGAPLSPGIIAQVYGTGLASAATSTGAAPLPTTFNNTFALVGPTQAPLYFLSSGQINIQIPNDATATQQTPIVLSVNNALTLPLMLNIVPATPGVLSADDGPTPPDVQNFAHIIAQHSADFSLVTSTNPAKPGEYLVMYLVGMGATNPPVASGASSPSSPLAQVTSQPTVMVDSQPSTVAFAGLTPGFVGLYQVNFQVPSGAKSGELEVDVSQNGVAANPTLLPVGN